MHVWLHFDQQRKKKIYTKLDMRLVFFVFFRLEIVKWRQKFNAIE